MEISLKKTSGLNLKLDTLTGKLSISDPSLSLPQEQYRTLGELQEYLKEEFSPGKSKEIAYIMYRNICLAEDEQKFKGANLRYDITVILPRSIGKEYIKTAGHYHPTKPGTNVAYPESIEVISGHGYFILQKKDKDDDGLIKEIYLVEALPGEKIIFPPGFGHSTINAFNEPLVISNIEANTFSNDYEGFRRHRGAGYWLLEGDTPDNTEIEKNTFYTSVPEVKKIRPKEQPKLGFKKSLTLYESLAKNPEDFAYLTQPEDFTKELIIEKCFKTIR